MLWNDRLWNFAFHLEFGILELEILHSLFRRPGVVCFWHPSITDSLTIVSRICIILSESWSTRMRIVLAYIQVQTFLCWLDQLLVLQRVQQWWSSVVWLPGGHSVLTKQPLSPPCSYHYQYLIRDKMHYELKLNYVILISYWLVCYWLQHHYMPISLTFSQTTPCDVQIAVQNSLRVLCLML